MKNFSELISYQNKLLINNFSIKREVSIEESLDIFNSLKFWLWIAFRYKNDFPNKPGLTIYRPFFIMDEMWHEFILFTFDYCEFCNSYFGQYMHHQPELIGVVRNKSDLEKSIVEIKSQCEYIRSKIDRDMFIKWYFLYPKKYQNL